MKKLAGTQPEIEHAEELRRERMDILNAAAGESDAYARKKIDRIVERIESILSAQVYIDARHSSLYQLLIRAAVVGGQSYHEAKRDLAADGLDAPAVDEIEYSGRAILGEVLMPRDSRRALLSDVEFAVSRGVRYAVSRPDLARMVGGDLAAGLLGFDDPLKMKEFLDKLNAFIDERGWTVAYHRYNAVISKKGDG